MSQDEDTKKLAEEKRLKKKRIAFFQRLVKRQRESFPSDRARLEASAACGVSRQMHYNWEYKGVDPAELEFQAIARLCYSLGISADQLAVDLGLICDLGKNQSQIELATDELSSAMKEICPRQMASYLQKLLKKHRLNWKMAKHVEIFAYGPGGPQEGSNVWAPAEIPRLRSILKGDIDRLRPSDVGSLARSVSVLTGEDITPNQLVEIVGLGQQNHEKEDRRSDCLG